jgi:hypothetical protein
LSGAGLKKWGYILIYRIVTYAHAWVSGKYWYENVVSAYLIRAIIAGGGLLQDGMPHTANLLAEGLETGNDTSGLVRMSM